MIMNKKNTIIPNEMPQRITTTPILNPCKLVELYTVRQFTIPTCYQFQDRLDDYSVFLHVPNPIRVLSAW